MERDEGGAVGVDRGAGVERPENRAALTNGIDQPIFAPDSWGGYLIYRLYPENRVFVDDRHDFYGVDFLRDYLKAIRLTPDWDKFLNEKHVNWALQRAITGKPGPVYVDMPGDILYQKIDEDQIDWSPCERPMMESRTARSFSSLASIADCRRPLAASEMESMGVLSQKQVQTLDRS